MKLTIFDAQDKFKNEEFLEFVLLKMKQRLYSQLDVNKLRKAEEFFNKYSRYKSVYKKYISAREVVISGILNIEYKVTGNKIVFEINSVQIFPSTDAKLYEMCKLINNGNLLLRGYPIFSSTFDYFKEHLNEYYDLFINRGM